MDRTEALKILGLTSSATKQQIQSQYRKLAKIRHSDKGGKDKLMAELNQARQIALESNTALVPIDKIVDIVLSTNKAIVDQQKRQELQNRSLALVTDIKNRQTSKLKATKRTATFAGSISGGIALLSTQFLPILKEIVTPVAMLAQLPIVFGTIGAACAGVYWLANQKVARIEQKIDDLKNALDDKSTFVEVFNSILNMQENGGNNKMSPTKTQLYRFVKRWAQGPSVVKSDLDTTTDSFSTELINLQIYAIDLGEIDFTNILINKGLEHNLLVVCDVVEGNHLRSEYKLALDK